MSGSRQTYANACPYCPAIFYSDYFAVVASRRLEQHIAERHPTQEGRSDDKQRPSVASDHP